MINATSQKSENRRLMLSKFYEMTEGKTETYVVSLWDVATALMWDRDTLEATYDYLAGEGLLKAVTLGGGVSITHKGRVEVENGMPSLSVRNSNPASRVKVMQNLHESVGSDVVGVVKGDMVISPYRDEASSSKQNLLAVAADIQEILERTSITSLETTAQRLRAAAEAVACIEGDPALLRRIRSVFNVHSRDELSHLLDHPAANLVLTALSDDV